MTGNQTVCQTQNGLPVKDPEMTAVANIGRETVSFYGEGIVPIEEEVTSQPSPDSGYDEIMCTDNQGTSNFDKTYFLSQMLKKMFKKCVKKDVSKDVSKNVSKNVSKKCFKALTHFLKHLKQIFWTNIFWKFLKHFFETCF